MGLKPSDREGAEFSKEARSEGERSLKKSPVRKSRSHSQERKSSGVRSFESGDLKRKGEILLSDVPKQARRSPRVQTARQREAKQSREYSQEKHSELRGPKATRSLTSIFQEESARKAEGIEKRRTVDSAKEKPQPHKTPRLRKMSARKERSPTKEMTTTEVRQDENISVIAAVSLSEIDAEVHLEESVVNFEDSHNVTNNPVFEEVVSTTMSLNQSEEVRLIPMSELISKEVVTTVVPEEVQTEHSVLQTVPVSLLHRKMMEIRLMVKEEKRTNSVIIREKESRTVKAQFKPLVFDDCIMHLLDQGYRKFVAQLKRVAREPYPPEISEEPPTMYPVRESTVIMVVPDFQLPYHVEPDMDKGKKKLHPEFVLDDMTTEEIAEQVRLIDEACEVQRNASAICVYQDPGTSQSKVSDDDPVGGALRECQYTPLKIGALECSYFVMKIILRERPLWDITSFEEVLPWCTKTLPRLPVPYDIELPEPNLPVPPPLLQLIDQVAPTEDAYSTTVAIVPAKSKGKAVKRSAAKPLSLEQKVDKLLKEMSKVKKLLKKLGKQSGQ